MYREGKIWNLQGDKNNRMQRRLTNFSVFTEKKKKYLWVMLLNLEMNNKETELISSKKGSKIIPVEQIELECKC